MGARPTAHTGSLTLPAASPRPLGRPTSLAGRCRAGGGCRRHGSTRERCSRCRLTDAGARVLVVDAHRISVFDASSVRRLSSAAITPAPAAPSAAAISPDGRTVAVGSPTGQVSFVDPSTGDARPGTGAHGSPVTSLTYSPDGRAVASTGTDNKVTIWDPRAARPAQVLTAPAEQVQYVAFGPDGTTLYTSSLGGVLLAWDLTGDRSFGRRFPLGGGSPCCRRGLAARAAARALARWHHVRGPPRHVDRRLVLRPHAAPARHRSPSSPRAP